MNDLGELRRAKMKGEGLVILHLMQVQGVRELGVSPILLLPISFRTSTVTALRYFS